MLPLKSEAIGSALSEKPHEAQKELEHWEQLVFSFEMDKDIPSSTSNTSRGQKPRRSRSSSSTQPGGSNNPGVEDAALLAQFAAAAAEHNTGLDQTFAQTMNTIPYTTVMPPAGLYGGFYYPAGLPHTSLPPISSLNFPWNPIAQGEHPLYNFQSNAPPGIPPILLGNSGYQIHPQPAIPPSTGSARRPAITTPAATSSTITPQQGTSTSSPSTSTQPSSPPGDLDISETEHTNIAEEKRRRNTAASARFRIKKKLRTVNLERSVSDLTGRAEELEKEVIDLRRENGWLKEIVMLKGTQYTAANAENRLALSQAVQAAGIDLNLQPIEGLGQAGNSRSQPDVQEESSGEEQNDTDKTAKGKGKGKGKRPDKGKDK